MDEHDKDYIYEFSGQKADNMPGCGVCDTSAIEAESLQLVVQRFARGDVRFTNAVGVLTAAAQTITLFSKGLGESGADAQVDGTLTRSDTNAFTNGALVANEGTHFRALAMQVMLGSLFLRDNTGATQADAEWMVNQTTGNGYQAAAQEAVRQGFRLSLAQTQGNTERDLGLVAHYPSMYGGGSNGRNSANGEPIANAVIPFRAAVKFGTKSGGASNFVVKLTNDRSLILGARTDPSTAACNLPVYVTLLGYVARGGVGSAPDVTPQDSAALAAIQKRQERVESTLAQVAESQAQIARMLAAGKGG